MASNLLYTMALPSLAACLYPPKHQASTRPSTRPLPARAPGLWHGSLLPGHFLFACNLLGGIIFLTCISLRRYLGIVHPFWHSRLQPKHTWARPWLPCWPLPRSASPA